MQTTRMKAVFEPAISKVVGQSIAVIRVPAVQTDRMDVRKVRRQRMPVAIQKSSLRLNNSITFFMLSVLFLFTVAQKDHALKKHHVTPMLHEKGQILLCPP